MKNDKDILRMNAGVELIVAKLVYYFTIWLGNWFK